MMTEGKRSSLKEFAELFLTAERNKHTKTGQLIQIALDSLDKESGWVKCTERMPEQGQEVLALYEGGHMNVLFISRTGDGWDDGGYSSSISLSHITHWKRLPELPEEA